MYKLLKTLDKLSTLLKQVNARLSVPKLPTQPASAPRMPRMPKPAAMPSGVSTKIPQAPKMSQVNVSPASKKDPIKIAQQTQDQALKPQAMDAAKRVKESMRVSRHGQWSIIKAEGEPKTFAPVIKKKSQSKFKPGIIDSKVHGFDDTFHAKPEQSALIHGLNTAKSKAKLHRDQPEGVVKKAGWLRSSGHPHNVWVKSAISHPNFEKRGHDRLNATRREVLYHNMAHNFFDMGKHVPTTAGFTHEGDEYSAQKEVKGGKHPEPVIPGIKDPISTHDTAYPKDYTDTLKNLHDSGELHKLALMNNIMGHHDRHRRNFMYKPGENDKLHMIDNGTAFDYGNFDKGVLPKYLEHALSKNVLNTGHNPSLHVKAKEWLDNLDEQKAKKMFEAHGHHESDPHVKGFLDRLNGLKKLASDYPKADIDVLLRTNRNRSGKLFKRNGSVQTGKSRIKT